MDTCTSRLFSFFSKLILLGLLGFAISQPALAEGSKNLTPAFGAGDGTLTNQFIGYLMHDQEGGTSGNFLNASATANERLYIHVKNGETLYMGFRRILPVTNFSIGGGTFGNATLTLRENDGTLINTYGFTADGGSTQSASFVAGTGVIDSYAEALAGPSAVVGVSGYDAIVYTNNTGSDQDFYIELVEAAGEESWYDLWDISVYDGSTEKPGRIFCKRWGFNAGSFTNQLSSDFQLFVRIPSTIGGTTQGNYIKEVDLAGIQPFAMAIFANETGAAIASTSDLNSDGVTNFLDARRSQAGDVGDLQYDIFINNPDIELYPTTELPSVSITDAVFYCNAAGTGGEAIITLQSNQSGIVALLLDLNGVTGYDEGTTDVIIEQEIDASSGTGSATVRWDGLDGLGAAVSSGTTISVTGRFTSGALHIPIFDGEQNTVGINMLDVRPQTSFDLIYWDDQENPGSLDSSPTTQLTGTNTGQHTWTEENGDGSGGGNAYTVNTWSFGYYEANTQNVTFSFACDSDGDGITGSTDLDSDNDGVTDANEGSHKDDTDADGIPDYLDSDFAGYVDSNNDGVNDNFDPDLDGIPSSLDVDSDNDGIPDMVENNQTDGDNDGTFDEGAGISDENGNGLHDAADPACIGGTTNFAGNATAVAASNSANNTANALGAPDNARSAMNNLNDYLILDMGITIPSGQSVTIDARVTNNAHQMGVGQSTTGVDGDEINDQQFSFAAITTDENIVYTLTADARYIHLVMAVDNGSGAVQIDAVFYDYDIANCSGAAITIVDTDSDGTNNYLDLDSDNDGIVDVIEAGGTANNGTGQIDGFTDSNSNGLNDTQESVALSRPDTDGDGTLTDLLDIDSDNDGILDNVESQDSQNYIASAAGDTDGDGLLDVYDPNNGGTLLDPVDTDSNGTDDILSPDSDGDGVDDFVEGWDDNSDGYSDLDSNTDGVISDETGYNTDSDSDGLWDIFESSSAPTPNTDGADKSDWQDTDDDNDGLLTSGEDTNTNGNWADDRTQGQGGGSSIPDYLYRGDYDGDAIADASDADSDNDGILDTDEDNGESVDPSGDLDNDGIANYRDADDTGVTGFLSATTDANSDGVYDVFDSDLDGVPDFLDLDSDNDGIWDAVEANEGAVPNGLSTTTGQFALDDPDNDGLMNFVDTDDVTTGGISNLANPDTDSDGLSDYRDIDSDGDGITDIIEAQTTAAFIGLANNDSDGDGIDDNFDPSSGGTQITPVNSDGVDVEDYLDSDSDNDGVTDAAEGDDANFDGYGDWDANTNNIVDDGAFNVDTDGDGLSDLFDTITLGTVGNETGSNADLQNTDGIDFRNWRDNNDDNDAVLTEDEDANGNNNWADDLNADASGNVPDFLFFNDFDNDLITDANDGDSDNDGILDVDEDGGESVDPSGDADSDGIPNFKDPDITGLSSTADTNGDGIFDVFDQDLDGIPDFRDRDSDNDGVPDLVEAGGTDADGNGIADGLEDADNDGIPDGVDVDQTGGVDSDGDSIDDAFDFSIAGGTDTDGDDIIDSADPDSDGDGIADTYDANNGGTTLTPADNDGDGLVDYLDLDSDNDGIPDLIEYAGTDTNGDGQLDDLTDSNNDGLADLVDTANGGIALTRPDNDGDGIRDYIDLDSDNDGLTDTVESGGTDTNNDGAIDGAGTDTDADGLADDVDPDNSGTPIGNSDIDGDGVLDFRDLDVDNDGYPDILEAGGTDSDNDGIVNNQLDSDNDGIPDNVDVSQFATNGGSGTDTDADQIDDSFDVDQTGGSDDDGDGIDNTHDTDANGDGYDDAVETTPYGQEDKEGDGNKDFRDMDSDGDGIPDVTEFGQTVNTANAQINGFTDSNTNGWNDTQESTPITPPNGDSDGQANYQDIDSDDDGLPDNIEAQTRASFIAISNADTDNDGLDDAYDPDNGGTIITPPNTDGTGNDDYLDTDSDGDTVPDVIEGDNDDRSQYGDWDTNNNNDPTDETGYSADNDADGLRDLFDNDFSNTSANVTGSNSDGQDSDNDGTWDFQDTDDDADGLLTSSQGGGNEDSDSDGDPTNDFDDDADNIIPNYLFGNDDTDGDSFSDQLDFDSDNDGLADTSEAGGTGIDPSADPDNDGLLNFEDDDMDGDGTANSADTDGDGAGNSTTGLTDTNTDGVFDQFDKDLDGIPDFRDLDSDNDGIADIVEFGISDTDEDGTVDNGGGVTDANNNGMEDTYDPECAVATPVSGNATAVAAENSINNSANSTGAVDGNRAAINAVGDFLILDMGVTVPNGATITINARVTNNIGHILEAGQSTAGTDGSETNVTVFPAFPATGTDTDNQFTLNADARYIHLQMNTDGGAGAIQIDAITYNYNTFPCSGSSITIPDSDSDGISNHLDLDSDNDGIVDNVEAQATASYIAPVAGDTDGDGLLNVYDEDIAVGNAIDPVNTDVADTDDYVDTDSDNDGVLDYVEAFDSNSDGYGSWDSDNDGSITDEAGYNIDSDNDGIWVIFDNVSGLGSIANITGSNAQRQDTDSDTAEDWRDTDDDDDGLLTSSTGAGNENADGDGSWANDFTQGGGSVPNYLYNPDVDGDNVMDQVDGDSDNDGILNTDEYAGAIYASSGTPFDDADGDGIYNYLDDNDVNNTSFVDVNGDGVDDQVDQDRDGVPNFFDLDADNDGILDGIEANDGAVPTNFSTTTGRFSSGDSDGDGIDDQVDTSTGGTALNKSNSDTDTLDDYLDLDSDNDGLTDHLEGQTTVSYVVPSGNDTDRDGLDDTFDGNNGGTALVPTNTDGTDNPDYLDNDSDNDNDGDGTLPDVTEGYDANRNGFSDLDSNQNGSLADETGFGADADSDGIEDIFDTFSGRGVNNITGTSADLQDTDSDGTIDFRDVDDDGDQLITAVEDIDNDGDWTNDKFQGGGATPDYLFFNDSDNDRVADGQDVDGDNDGIFDSDEYDNTVYRNPFEDQDNDGIFNYNDPDDPTDLSGGALTDSNGDGIWDEYDLDLDGVPNFFDLDSDNDGIPDILEAGGTDTNDDGIIDGLTDTDNDGLLDNVDVDQTGGTDSDLDGIDDAFDFSVSGGTDNDGDDIEDSADFDDDGDGVVNVIDSDEGGTPWPDEDFDGDGLKNRYDLDSDSDGLTDLIEARGSDTDGDGVLDTTGDTDGDGWGNLHDPDNGGTVLTLPNTDGTDNEDYLDIDSDRDGIFDYNEAFDDDEDDNFTDDYIDRATAFGNASFYDPLDLFWYSTDSDADDTPDFLDPDSPRFVDTDGDGIIDLFDTDNGGDFYGNVGGKPDNDTDGEENYIDLDGGFSLSTFSITTGENGTNDNFTVVLTQQPTTNVVINISETSDEISLGTTQLTFTNGNWNVAQSVTVNGEDDSDNDGDIGYTVLVSVSDANSDDDFDDASDQNVFGSNLDDEGSIRVSTNTINTAENGSTVDFTVELSVAPTTNVVIDLSESSDEGSISATQLTFTNGDWDTPQTVTVTPADDNLLDGDQVYNITASVNDGLSDDGFDAAADEIIAVTNADDDEGFILSSTSVVTSESGTTAQFTVVLDVQPGAGQVVEIDLTESSDEGSVNPVTLTFDETDWNIAQTVTVTPADDSDEDGNQVYNITVSIDAANTTDNSFDALANQNVSVTNQDDDTTPLPLDLLSFDAEYESGSVWLTWETTNERNVNYMAVERSTDGITFEELGKIAANNIQEAINSYDFEDDQPVSGFNYYRLNTVDFDGSLEISQVIAVVASIQSLNINVYPNPVIDRLTISSTFSMGNMSYVIYDMTGKIWMRGVFPDDQFEVLLDFEEMPSGIYHLRLTSPETSQQYKLKKH